MLFTAKSDLPDLCKELTERTKAIEARIRAELEKLDNDKELRAEVVAERKNQVVAEYADAMRALRQEFAGKIFNRIDEVRKIGAMVKAPAMNPQSINVISLLQAAPQITLPMLERAAVQVANDEIAVEVLRQLADRAGYSAEVAAIIPPAERHLTKADCDDAADSLTNAVNMFLDSHSILNSAIDSDSERFLNAAQRTESEAEMGDIMRGAPFTFGGDFKIAAEFDAISANAEL